MTFDDAYNKLAGILDGCLVCNGFSISADKNRLKVFYTEGYNESWQTAKKHYEGVMDNLLNHLNLSPVERHAIDIMIKENML